MIKIHWSFFADYMACSVPGFFQSSRQQSILQKLLKWICILNTNWLCETDKYLACSSTENMYRKYLPTTNQNYVPVYDLSQQYQQLHVPQQYQQLHNLYATMPYANHNILAPVNHNFRPRPPFAGGRRHKQFQQFSNFHYVNMQQPSYHQQARVEIVDNEDHMSFATPRKYVFIVNNGLFKIEMSSLHNSL